MKAAVRTETDKENKKREKNQNPSQPDMEIMYSKIGTLFEDSF